MENSTENTNWKTTMRCFNPAKTPPYDVMADQIIPESNFCVKMPNYSGPLGRPVDANLAVNFIFNFFAAVNIAYGPDEDSDIDKLTPDQIKTDYLKARVFLKVLRELDYGMSVDKAFILKMLSQPQCEGLRGYLCINSDNQLSLVTVGIDKDGFDLNYAQSNSVDYGKVAKEVAVLPSINKTPPLKAVKMQSLNGEYVTPPFTIMLTDLDESTKLDIKPTTQDIVPGPYVLLNIATGKQELLNFKDKPIS